MHCHLGHSYQRMRFYRYKAVLEIMSALFQIRVLAGLLKLKLGRPICGFNSMCKIFVSRDDICFVTLMLVAANMSSSQRFLIHRL